jgi:hypothetical protein
MKPENWKPGDVVHPVPVYNPTLQKLKWTCASRVYEFDPDSYQMVEYDHIVYLKEQMWQWGLFVMERGQDFKEARRQALIKYLTGGLQQIINGWESYKDDYRKRGIEIEDPPKLKEAKRWKKELEFHLEKEAPIEERLSFLSDEERKQIGIEEKCAIRKSEEPNIFSALEEIKVVEDVVPQAIRDRAKRAPKSFDETLGA